MDEVSRAQEAENDARQRAEDAMKAMHEYVEGIRSDAHNKSAIAALADGMEAHVRQEFRDRRDQIDSRLRDIGSSIKDIRGKENQTADDTAHIEALQKEAHVLDAEREKLDLDHEIREMRHACHDAEADENRKAKAMEKDGRAAAKEWKSAARRTERAKKAAGVGERVYEGEYQDTEQVSERMHDRFQDENDAASNAIEKLYQSVAKVLDSRADELRHEQKSEEAHAEVQQPLAAVLLVDPSLGASAASAGQQPAGEPKESKEAVTEAEAEEAAAKQDAEDAYAKIEKREADLRATLHNDTALDGLAQQVKDRVHPDFAPKEDEILGQMREDREERDALLANPNRTAEDLKRARALDARLAQRRDELRDVRKSELRACHAQCKEREIAEKHSARELRSTAKDAATEWKRTARRTEHARKKAEMSERFYEGAFQEAEEKSERLHDRAENVGDDAGEWVEKIYEAVWKRLERDEREAESADEAAAPSAGLDASSSADDALVAEQGSARADDPAAVPTQEALAASPMADFSVADRRGALVAFACFAGAIFLANGMAMLRLRNVRGVAAQRIQQPLLPEASV